MSYFVRLLGVATLLCSLVANVAAAQGRRHPRSEIPGFDFRKDGVWRTKARSVRALRARLLAAGQFAALNQRGPAPAAALVSGVLKVPAILFRYKDSPLPQFTPADYDAVLFAATPAGIAAGRPYTYRSLYQEMSNNVFDIEGSSFGFVSLDSNEVYYVGGTSSICAQSNPYGSSNCNGLFSSPALSRMQGGLREALTKLDATVDFSQYADNSGFVPLALFMHQAKGGECGPSGNPENHIWSHRFSLSSPFTTNDTFNGQPVRIGDYILQSGVGGATSCIPTEIMPIGTVAHETGHGLGLPDLYDTGDQTEGVGQWDFMSSGSFTTGFSPARMSAWSLNELGWITLAELTTTGTSSFDAAPLSDSAYLVRVQGSNPRNEYFLLENRQRQQADTAVIRIHCNRAGTPPGCPGGLLIWHVDGQKVAQGLFNNSVNTGPIHGVALVQADGFRNLDAAPVSGNFCPPAQILLGCSNRGDAGDLFPGATNNTSFSFRTNPAALKNLDGSFIGFAVDSIKQLITDRTMSFRLRFGGLTVVRASDTTAAIQFAGTSYNVYRDLLEQGQSYTVGFTDPQISANGRTRFHFVSWSDGGAITHSHTGQLAGGTLTANVARDFKLIATSDAGGSIQADTTPPIDLTGGTFITEGRAVTLTATAGSLSFCGWSGDTTSSNTGVTLPMQKPYTVHASFGTSPTITSAGARPAGIMGATYADTLQISGGSSNRVWSLVSGALPPGLTLSAAGVISGFPQQTGDFAFTAEVISCFTTTKAFTLSVTAPTLVTADVTAHLLGPTAPLNPDQVRYLDLLGNNNSMFDIGDFLAWVKATGAPPSPPLKGGRP